MLINGEKSIQRKKYYEVSPWSRQSSRGADIWVENRSTIMDDAFIRLYIGELLRSLRTQYLIDLIKPYTRLELSFLAQQLNVDKDEVEELLIGLILDGKVDGRIDQVTMRLELDKQSVLMSDSFQLSTDQPMAQAKPRKTTICGARTMDGSP